MIGKISFFDGYEVERFSFEGDRVVRAHQSWFEDAIMEENRRVRADGVRDLSFGRPVLQMSLSQFYQVRKKYPEIDCPDGEVRKQAWLKVFNDPDYAGLRTGRW